MIKAIIVDDELSAIKNLEWEINKFCEGITVTDTFTDPTEAISAINYLKPDCVFLDIEMPEIDGFQLLNSLKYRDFDLIITTAFDNYAIKAFKENAIDYLLKPIDSDDLVKSVERIKQNKEKNNLGWDFKKAFQDAIPKNTKVALPFAGKTLFVDPDEILYCQSDGNYTKVYFTEMKCEILSKTIKRVEMIIGSQDFFRVHNSFLVNTKYIKEFVKGDGQYLVLSNGETIPVSRNKKDLLLQSLTK
jgi:two-component system LytT family response regulator